MEHWTLHAGGAWLNEVTKVNYIIWCKVSSIIFSLSGCGIEWKLMSYCRNYNKDALHCVIGVFVSNGKEIHQKEIHRYNLKIPCSLDFWCKQ